MGSWFWVLQAGPNSCHKCPYWRSRIWIQMMMIQRGRQFGMTGPQAREGQGMLAATGSWKRQMGSPSEAQESSPLLALDLLFLASGTMRECISVVWSPRALVGYMLWHWQTANPSAKRHHCLFPSQRMPYIYRIENREVAPVTPELIKLSQDGWFEANVGTKQVSKGEKKEKKKSDFIELLYLFVNVAYL